jgi:hypothetical protein
MFIEPIRIVAAGLAHASIGVNAMLAIQTRDGSDPAPPNVATFEESTKMEVALDRLPDERPVIAVQHYRVTGIGPLEVQGPHVDYRAELLVRSAVRDDQAEAGARDLLYLQHAILMSLHRLHHNDQAALRTRGNVMLIEFSDITWVRHFAPVQGAEVTAAFIVPYLARTLQP